MSKSKNIFNVIFLIAVFLITIHYIFQGKDMSSLIYYIQKTDLRYWIAAVFCIIFFVGSESVLIFYMMHSIQQKVYLTHCFLYSFVGFFFSCITPSATGGQPAQIYYMKKDKIPIPVATLVLMVITITYKMVLIVLGISVLIIRPAKVMIYLSPVKGICYLGLLLNVFCVGFMVLLVFHPSIAKNILISTIKVLSKIKLIKHPSRYLERIEGAMQQYQEVAIYFRTHRLVIINVFLITVFQRVIFFYITYLTYRSFGLKGESWITIVLLQGMIAVAVDMLPLPGGMGISEKLFLMIFTPMLGNITLPAMVVSRGLSFYAELILCALFTIVAHIVIGRKGNTKGNKNDDRIL